MIPINKSVARGATTILLLYCFSAVGEISSQPDNYPDKGIKKEQEVKKKSKIFNRKPKWIRMMEDPDVNYFKALKAFDKYWEKRKNPKEEYKETGEKPEYYYDYKRFKNWKKTVSYYVTPEGKILSPEERLKVWERQMKSR